MQRPLSRPNPRDATLEVFAGGRLESDRLLPGEGPLLVAVSGGPDSMALLHFLAAHHARTGLPSGGIVAAHVNHRLRGAESDADAAFTREAAARWGIRCAEADAGPIRPGSEESARHARYDALRGLATEAGADRAATAHTADDQAETVLLRLVRGAGLRGLRGMPSRGTVRGLRVVRPFLDVTREQVLEYLRGHGLEYRVDSTNASLAPARNFVRLEVLPLLRSRLNPAAREAILRSAEAAREVDGYLHAEAARLLPDVLRREEEGNLSLDASRMLLYPKLLNTYLFRLALLELNGTVRDLTAAHIQALLSLVSTARRRSADLPGGIRAGRERERVVLSRRIREPARPKGPSNT